MLLWVLPPLGELKSPLDFTVSSTKSSNREVDLEYLNGSLEVSRAGSGGQFWGASGDELLTRAETAEDHITESKVLFMDRYMGHLAEDASSFECSVASSHSGSQGMHLGMKSSLRWYSVDAFSEGPSYPVHFVCETALVTLASWSLCCFDSGKATQAGELTCAR